MLDENWQDRETKASLGFQIEVALFGAVVLFGLLGGAYWVWTLFAR